MKLNSLFLGVSAAALLAGCGSDGANEFAGDYAGVATNSDAYFAIEGKVADDGTITGKLYVYDGTVAPPVSTDYPGSDYGDILDLTGKVEGAIVTAETDGGEYSITGTFDENGVFTGQFDDIDDELNSVAAFPVAADDTISIACGGYDMDTPSSVRGASYYGDAMFITNGTDVYGILDSDDDGTDLFATFSGTLGENMCPSMGYCQELDGDFAGTWDDEALDIGVEYGSGETDTETDYTWFGVLIEFSGDSGSGGLDADTDWCYSWDYEI